jgi:hypothetical protein
MSESFPGLGTFRRDKGRRNNQNQKKEKKKKEAGRDSTALDRAAEKGFFRCYCIDVHDGFLSTEERNIKEEKDRGEKDAEQGRR